MRALVSILILTAILFSGCHSQREVVSHLTDYHDSRDSKIVTASVESKEHTWTHILEMCKSLNLQLTADSIVTPEGVIYSPAVSVCAEEPVRITDTATEIETVDTTHIEHLSEVTDDSTADLIDTRENVAVVKPVTWWPLYLLGGIALFIAVRRYLRTQ